MRRVLTAVGITAALLVGGAVAADAAPKNKPCVTTTEFGKVKVGQSKAKVAKIFGTKGKRDSIGPDGHGYTNEVRQYKACKAPGAIVTVTFASGADLPATKVGWANSKSWVEGWTQ
ncbi:hypothetical protein LWF15_19720 [Kineosporia rhizophila]|uniref:hypothetical protein n=1 Tax=Kineosporia TaxID=49184 RepID=UPI000A49B368|nr:MULTISPECIES: hypothetical protein [Kineosporia]MCE0537724.1 hypothetical protein [Kineosporia rhizophila]GLY15700.1 hypothetical protein Kisp01_27150 [Kineosporia sp. NBRC 101677]